MADTAVSTEWRKWSGGNAPVADHVRVDVRLRDGREYFNDFAGCFRWEQGDTWGPASDLIAYRIAARSA